MANTVTAMNAVSVGIGGAFSGARCTPYLVNYDQVNQDLQITKAAANQMAYVVGMQLSNTAAFKPIWKSDALNLVRHELGANSGFSEAFIPSAPRVICHTNLGGALNFRCDVALPPFIVWVIEA